MRGRCRAVVVVLVGSFVAVGCGSGAEEVPMLSSTSTDPVDALSEPRSNAAGTILPVDEIESGSVPSDVCPLPRSATIVEIFGAPTLGVRAPGPSCRWEGEAAEITVSASSAVGHLAKFRRYVEGHNHVDSPNGLGGPAALSHDAGSWGIGLATSGVWFEISGAPTREAALALGADLAAAVRR
jgi:hypothetical protein